MKNSTFVGVLVGGIALVAILYVFGQTAGGTTVSPPPGWVQPSRNYLTSLQCSFKDFQTIDYEDPDQVWNGDSLNKKLVYKFSENQDALVVNFIDLDTDSPRMAGNNGSASLIKVLDTDEVMVLLENNGNGVFNYTYFKDSGVMAWTKSYQIVVNPYSHQSFGYCE